MLTDDIPNCPAGPQHPYSDLKKGMEVVHEEGERVIFGCVACLEVNRTQQIIVRTLPKGWEKATHSNQARRKELLARFQNLPRTKSGRLLIHKAKEKQYVP